MSYEAYRIRGFKFPELLRQYGKKHDPVKATSYHEIGHGLVMVYYGLLPRRTALISRTGTNGFVSTAFESGWPIGVDWGKEVPEFLLMWSYAGCCAAAAYTGFYNWMGASADLKDAKQDADQYDVDFKQQLRIWKKTNDFVIEYFDLLELAAERLFKDRFLGSEFWEEEILLCPEIYLVPSYNRDDDSSLK